jgi:hypothetical protein
MTSLYLLAQTGVDLKARKSGIGQIVILYHLHMDFFRVWAKKLPSGTCSLMSISSMYESKEVRFQTNGGHGILLIQTFWRGKRGANCLVPTGARCETKK